MNNKFTKIQQVYLNSDIHLLSPLHMIHIVKNSRDSSYRVLASAGLFNEKKNIFMFV